VSVPTGLGPPFHVGVATGDIEALQRALGPLLGLTFVALPRPGIKHNTPGGPVSPSPAVVWSSEGPLHVELVETGPGTVYATDRPTYLHHVGYWSDDLRADVARCEAEGWTVEATLNDGDGRPSSFAYLSSPGGPWIELIDRANQSWLFSLLRGGTDA
jgi:hypothetical protein